MEGKGLVELYENGVLRELEAMCGGVLGEAAWSGESAIFNLISL